MQKKEKEKEEGSLGRKKRKKVGKEDGTESKKIM